ncbi:hypothetical protein ACIQUB_16620 [Rhizobium sp. NPDC090275]|uniref:hypothetical protein n=1 Tax=Rhizobium sp. NPDC090275 TaxID=3364498 RepID=UPI00383A554A
MTDRFTKGDIVSYPYLWRWQRDADPGRDHGEKDRPTCLILTMVDAKGLTHMLLLPISSKPPFEGQTAIEIPRLELQRANLSKYGRGWITVSECNYDILEKSYHFDPGQTALGKFSDPFLEVLRQKFAPFLKAGAARINRT